MAELGDAPGAMPQRQQTLLLRVLGDHLTWIALIWITLAFMVQFSWGNGTRAGAWLYPGWMVLIWIGLLALMIKPRRWCDLLADSPAHRSESRAGRPLREVA